MNTDTCRTEFFTLRVRGFSSICNWVLYFSIKQFLRLIICWQAFAFKLCLIEIMYQLFGHGGFDDIITEQSTSCQILYMRMVLSLLKEKHSSWPEMVQGTPFLFDCEWQTVETGSKFCKKTVFFLFSWKYKPNKLWGWLKRPWKRGFWSTCKRKGKCCLDEEVAVRNIAVTVARWMALWFHFLPVCWALVSFHWAKPHSKNDNIRWQWLNNYEALVP